MHQVILTQRRVAAISRIVERATALAEHLDLDPQLIQGLQPSGTIKEAPVADMIRLEGVANVLDQVAEKSGVPAPAVTDVTVTKFKAPVVPIEESLSEQVIEGPLPAPVLEPDEEEPEEKPAARKRSKK